jgi:hypothetical protein
MMVEEVVTVVAMEDQDNLVEWEEGVVEEEEWEGVGGTVGGMGEMEMVVGTVVEEDEVVMVVVGTGVVEEEDVVVMVVVGAGVVEEEDVGPAIPPLSFVPKWYQD